jgi:histidinol-phosphatase (PHP family)
MLTNYHTHTVFCDGKDTPEQMLLGAIEKGFDALGFSGHGYTRMDSSFCMKDLPGYFAAVRSLKEKYADRIQVYLGVEEDVIHPANRADYDYIIGSSHYIVKDGVYYSVDGKPDCYNTCVELFGGDPLLYADAYYSTFCEYILWRKPDIIGHFDLLTKFDELNDLELMHDPKYIQLASGYMSQAISSECIFEVNTGAIARGMRKTPYPSEELLYQMKKQNAKIILSSDCHDRNFLDCYFAEARQLLRDIGFRTLYVLYDGEFRTTDI